MNLNCPSCQKMLQVPDQYAGQMMKCPLCGGTFNVPGLSAGGFTPAPAAPPPAPMPQESSSPSSPYANNEPTGGYHHVYTFYFTPKLVGWIAPLALLLAFGLLLTPWLTAATGTPRLSSTGFQTILGEYNSTLGLLYGLVFLPTLVLAMGAAIAGTMPSGSLPPAMLQLLPFRALLVLVACLVTFVFLFMQLLNGFGMEKLPEMLNETILRTFWLRLAVFAHVMAILGAAFDFWLAMRGNSKPIPKLELTW